jgi:crotonobetainyl-CoA:carnitine CoA-transferase CaiB-like acyl-CoA transferase
MAALGLGYETLAGLTPRLIYASISGYGQTGPQRTKGGFDLIAQGVSGIMSITGEPGGPPVKAGVPLTDLSAGLFALVGILAALESRHRTGVGQQVDTSLVDAGVALSVWEATEYFSGIGIPAALGSAHRMNAPYQAIRCADGYLTIGAGTIDCSDVSAKWNIRRADEPDFATVISAAGVADRRRHDRPAVPPLPEVSTARIFRGTDQRPRRSSPIQVVARGMVLETEYPVLGPLRRSGRRSS